MSTAGELVARARALAPVLRERAEKAERLRRMPDETLEDIVAAGLPRICQPARFGGFELGWDTVCEVAMELGRGCASQAWVSNVFTEHTCMLALFPDEAQHEVWDENPRALISTSYAPVGKVTPVAGGVRVSGHYTFSSGVHHAHWSIIGGMVPCEDKPGTYPGLMLIRAADRRIVDNWQVMGMPGTGSADFVVEDVFVPQHRILDDTLVFQGRTPGSAGQQGAGVPHAAERHCADGARVGADRRGARRCG
jgi:3-hydroxy-9,10-secoandrosta-1,3,5(10)-triene-9,17-dione monooxygenase